MAIVFEHKGTNYTLEFNRDTVRQLERNGFSVNDIASQPVNSVLILFRSSFLAHHPRLSQSVIDEIWDSLGNKDGLFEALIELYNEPVEALLSEPDDGKKITWKVK